MGSTLLQLVDTCFSELGLTAPTSVAGNPTQDVSQMQALMNASGSELITLYEWRDLTIPYLFYTQFLTTTGNWTNNGLTIQGIPDTTGLDTTYQAIGTGINQSTFITSVDSMNQVTINQRTTATGGVDATVYFQKMKYALPADYSAIVDRTQWDKSKHWEMLGPESPQQWEWLLSGYISTGPRIRWRLLGEYFQIWPGFSNAEFLGFEYRSKGWARNAAGTTINSMTTDTDTCIYPDRLMINMTKLKYFETKGFDTTAMFRNWQQQFEAAKALDAGAGNLSFAPSPGSVLLSYDNIPDSGYGTTSS